MFWHYFKRLEDKVDSLIKGMNNMTATLAQLDAAIAAEEGLETTFFAQVVQLIADYQALVASAQTGTDVTTELSEVNADAAKFTAAILSVTVADPKATGS